MKENYAIVKGRDLPISTKHAIEICSFIRNKTIERARDQLNQVLKKKLAIPLRRFHKDRGHRPGKMAAGFYPVKATTYIIKLLNTLEANAQNKGLSTKDLQICKSISNRASRPFHPGRRRTKLKRTHIEITAKEQEIKKPKKKVKK